MDAWGFTTENYRIPAEDELSALLKNVDASKIQYDKKTKITLPKNVKIDFGGIAKDIHLQGLCRFIKSAV